MVSVCTVFKTPLTKTADTTAVSQLVSSSEWTIFKTHVLKIEESVICKLPQLIMLMFSQVQ